MSEELVRNYYAAFGENEWHRLTRPEGVIEFAVTTHALNQHLPKHGRLLDIGGGPGRYSLWLAQRGYRVVLADLSPNLLDIARAKIAEAGVQSQIEDVVTGNVCNLSRFGDDSFDAPHAAQLEELAETDPQAHHQVMELIVRTANDPSLLGASIHLLYVGQKPTMSGG